MTDEPLSLGLFANTADPHNLHTTLAAIERAVYEPLAQLDATAWVTAEPVPYSQRTSGRLIRPKIGDTWGKLWDCAWFHFTGTVPTHDGDNQVVLLIDLGGEGCVVDAEGTPVCGLTSRSHGFDPRFGSARKRVVRLADMKPRASLDLWVDAGCNDLFGATSGGGRLREAHVAVEHRDLRALYYDFEVLWDLLQSLPPNSARHNRILRVLRQVRFQLWRFDDHEASQARAILRPELEKRGETASLHIGALGQGHLDLAWLWPLRETTRKAARTFSTALALMDRYPDYIFGASQPYLYEITKTLHPKLYDRIKQYVSSGRWEPQGPMWVESDVNVPSGESLVRQILYGRKFFRDEFGIEANTGWLPDDFGFPSSLPGILAGSGVKYFLTTKLSWSLVNIFPRHSFWWEGLDGRWILVHMPPEGTYNSAALPHSVSSVETRYADKQVSEHALLIYGVGDGGGGPGEEHLERLGRMYDLAGLPPVQRTRAKEFFEALESEARTSRFDSWTGELYLERHQGTYTTQGRTKRFNRKLEVALHDVELISCMAKLLRGHWYPIEGLERIWKEALLYQFHDILPGSSITRVYTESSVRYEALLSEASELLAQAIDAIRASLDTSGLQSPILVCNTLGWSRSGWITANGRSVSVENIPPMGFQAVDVAKQFDGDSRLIATDDRLENDTLVARFSPDGGVTSLVVKEGGREVIAGGKAANELLAFRDDGDAWDFPPDYRSGPQIRCRLDSVESFVERSRAVVRHRYSLGASTITQDVILVAGGSRLEFHTSVDWHERHTMLRTSFPVTVRSSESVCEIQFGAVKRSTVRNTSWETARDEVCAHKWVDLSDGRHGVALLNDCKYGHRITEDTLDLCLLRSPTAPDPIADQGHHEFTYALLPHDGGYAEGNVVREAYDLNVPLLVFSLGPPKASGRATFSLFRIDSDNVVVETVKRSEAGDEMVVRLYDTAGAGGRVRLSSDLSIRQAWSTNLVEEGRTAVPVVDNTIIVELGPFEISTLVVDLDGVS